LIDVRQVLTAASDAQLAEELLKSYAEVVENFALQKWKYSELDAGHFVENVRRFIDLKLFGQYTAIGTDLPKFNDPALQRYQNAPGDDSYRMILPRVLHSMYTVRNKRGVGHAGLVKPNEMDATLIMSGTKWALAELVRLNSAHTMDETAAAISSIVERQLDLLWKDGGTVRVLDHKMSTPDKVLVHLYDKSPQTRSALQAATEYKNPSDFGKVLKRLHETRYIEVGPDGVCRITTKGVAEAEKIVRAWTQKNKNGGSEPQKSS
jgi:hypothetical protein